MMVRIKYGMNDLTVRSSVNTALVLIRIDIICVLVCFGYCAIFISYPFINKYSTRFMRIHPIIIISAPSGAGKGTIIQELIRRDPRLSVSISATTRECRPGEEDGVNYYYLTEEEFRSRIQNDEFVEWEEVYPGIMYGTLKSEVERLWALEKIVIFELDVNGALALKKFYGEQSCAIFILPPSLEELQNRLIHRGSETAEEMEVRLKRAVYEIEQQVYFDATVKNDKLEPAIVEVAELIDQFVFGEK